jgi:hypothetical protein
VQEIRYREPLSARLLKMMTTGAIEPTRRIDPMKQIALLMLLLGSLLFASDCCAGNVSSCVTVKQGHSGQVLFNMCRDTVSVGWCVSKSGEPLCTKFDNKANLPSGGDYPTGEGYVRYGACNGADSMPKISEGLLFSCEN